MGQMLYTYPAMLAHAAEMDGHTAALVAAGQHVEAEQAALQSGWDGSTGMTYQAWQVQWNETMGQLVQAYHAMKTTHEGNTTTMANRDAAEAAKWA